MNHSFFANRRRSVCWSIRSSGVLLLLCPCLLLRPCLLTAAESPKIAELEQKAEQAEAQVITLAAQIEGDMTDEQSPHRTQLRAAVEQAFQARQSLHAAQLDRARANLNEATQRWDERERLATQIVDMRVERVLKEGAPAGLPVETADDPPAVLGRAEIEAPLQSPPRVVFFADLGSILRVKLAAASGQDMLRINTALASNFRGGMRVTELTGLTPAETGGLRIGDILIGVDRWRTTTQQELIDAFGMAVEEGEAQIPFYVVRFPGPVMGMSNTMGMGMEDMDMMGSGMGMEMGGVTPDPKPQILRGELPREKLIAGHNSILESSIEQIDDRIARLRSEKQEVLDQKNDGKTNQSNPPPPEDTPKTLELVTELALAQATLDEFTQLTDDTSLAQSEFVARLSQIIEDDTILETATEREQIVPHWRAILQQRVSSLQRKVTTLRELAAKREQERLDELRVKQQMQNAERLAKLDGDIHDLQTQREELVKLIGRPRVNPR